MEPLTEPQQQLFDWLTDYIREHQHSPSIRQMMHAMGLKSPAPVQSRLEHLRNKGYIDWTEGKARTIRILSANPTGIPIWGAIAAGGLVENFADTAEQEQFEFPNLSFRPGYFALKVRGDSMIDAMIDSGDVVIMRPVSDPKTLKDGTIAAVLVEGQTTLKHFHRKGSRVTLKPANPRYTPIEVSAAHVQVQGALVGVWRSSNFAF